jgi:hypothetical protein
MPVKRQGNPRQPKATPAGGSRRSISVQSLVPVGWAPGPAGEGTPLKLPPLEFSLPKEYTAPFALKNYESLCDQLRRRTRAGGQDALTVIVNARLTTQEPGRVKPTIILVSSYSAIL